MYDTTANLLAVVLTFGVMVGLWKIAGWTFVLLRSEFEPYFYLSGPIMLVIGLYVFVRYELPRARK